MSRSTSSASSRGAAASRAARTTPSTGGKTRPEHPMVVVHPRSERGTESRAQARKSDPEPPVPHRVVAVIMIEDPSRERPSAIHTGTWKSFSAAPGAAQMFAFLGRCIPTSLLGPLPDAVYNGDSCEVSQEAFRAWAKKALNDSTTGRPIAYYTLTLQSVTMDDTQPRYASTLSASQTAAESDDDDLSFDENEDDDESASDESSTDLSDTSDEDSAGETAVAAEPLFATLSSEDENDEESQSDDKSVDEEQGSAEEDEESSSTDEDGGEMAAASDDEDGPEEPSTPPSSASRRVDAKRGTQSSSDDALLQSPRTPVRAAPRALVVPRAPLRLKRPRFA